MDKAGPKISVEQTAVDSLFRFNGLKSEIFEWLEGFTGSDKTISPDWSEEVKLFAPLNVGDLPEVGLKLRVAFHLYTSKNQFLITVLESIELKDAKTLETNSVYILSAHLNWKNHELQMKRQLERSYGGPIEDMLSSSHTVWIQTVRQGGFYEALNSCATAMLANELTERPKSENHETPVKRPSAADSILNIPNHKESESGDKT